MILSHRWRFIFIKTRKTAGTSIEIMLARLCGPRDIVTPIRPPHTMHRPQNAGDQFFNHMTAEQVRSLQPDVFPRYFKFCFERHPIDKCLSQFAMLKNSPDHCRPSNPKTWEEYLQRGNFPIDVEKYCDKKGTVIVDKIYKYEEMASALRDISQRIDCPIGLPDTFEKSGFRYDVPTLDDIMHVPSQRSRIMSAFSDSLRVVPYD